MLTVNCDLTRVDYYTTSAWVCADMPVVIQIQTDLKPVPPSSGDVVVSGFNEQGYLAVRPSDNDFTGWNVGNFLTIQGTSDYDGTWQIISEYDSFSNTVNIDQTGYVSFQVGTGFIAFNGLACEVTITDDIKGESVSFRVPFNSDGLVQIDVSKYIRSFLEIDYEYTRSLPANYDYQSMWSRFSITATEVNLTSDGTQWVEQTLDSISIPESGVYYGQNFYNVVFPAFLSNVGNTSHPWTQISPDTMRIEFGVGDTTPILLFNRASSYTAPDGTLLFWQLKIKVVQGGDIDFNMSVGNFPTPVETVTSSQINENTPTGSFPYDDEGYLVVGLTSVSPATDLGDNIWVTINNPQTGDFIIDLQGISLVPQLQGVTPELVADVSRNLIGNKYSFNNIERVVWNREPETVFLVDGNVTYYHYDDDGGIFWNFYEQGAGTRPDFIHAVSYKNGVADQDLQIALNPSGATLGVKYLINFLRVFSDNFTKEEFERADYWELTLSDGSGDFGNPTKVIPVIGCGHSTHFAWVNSIGAWEWLRIFHKRDESHVIQNDKFYEVDQFQECDLPFVEGNYVEAYYQTRSNQEKTVLLKTKDEGFIDKVSQLRLSPRAQVWDEQRDGQGDKWLSCRLQKGSFIKFRTSTNLISLSFKYILSVDKSITT